MSKLVRCLSRVGRVLERTGEQMGAKIWGQTNLRDTRIESKVVSCFSVDGLATLLVLNLGTTVVLADI
jgi:hypothetical protein